MLVVCHASLHTLETNRFDVARRRQGTEQRPTNKRHAFVDACMPYDCCAYLLHVVLATSRAARRPRCSWLVWRIIGCLLLLPQLRPTSTFQRDLIDRVRCGETCRRRVSSPLRVLYVRLRHLYVFVCCMDKAATTLEAQRGFSRTAAAAPTAADAAPTSSGCTDAAAGNACAGFAQITVDSITPASAAAATTTQIGPPRIWNKRANCCRGKPTPVFGPHTFTQGATIPWACHLCPERIRLRAGAPDGGEHLVPINTPCSCGGVTTGETLLHV